MTPTEESINAAVERVLDQEKSARIWEDAAIWRDMRVLQESHNGLRNEVDAIHRAFCRLLWLLMAVAVGGDVTILLAFYRQF